MPQDTKKKPLGTIIAIYIVLLIVIALGVYLIKKTATPTNSNASTTNCQYDTNVCQFLETVQNPKKYYPGSFTASILTTKANGNENRVIVKTDDKNNLDIISYKENVLQGESILKDNTLYIRDVKANVWAKATSLPDDTLLHVKDRSLSQVGKNGGNITYTFMGSSSCGKFTCVKYQVTSTIPSASKSYVLFDESSHLLREAIIIDGQNVTTDTLFLYTPVTIISPMENK